MIPPGILVFMRMGLLIYRKYGSFSLSNNKKDLKLFGTILLQNNSQENKINLYFIFYQ